MQMLNTDFQTEERGEWVAMDVIRRFNDQLEIWEHSPGGNSEACCVISPGSFGPEQGGASVMLGTNGGSQMGKLQRIISHTIILGERMALNYSRWVAQFDFELWLKTCAELDLRMIDDSLHFSNLLAYGIRAAMYAGQAPISTQWFLHPQNDRWALIRNLI
jgi:hypothetical protein